MGKRPDFKEAQRLAKELLNAKLVDVLEDTELNRDMISLLPSAAESAMEIELELDKGETPDINELHDGLTAVPPTEDKDKTIRDYLVSMINPNTLQSSDDGKEYVHTFALLETLLALAHGNFDKVKQKNILAGLKEFQNKHAELQTETAQREEERRDSASVEEKAVTHKAWDIYDMISRDRTDLVPGYVPDALKEKIRAINENVDKHSEEILLPLKIAAVGELKTLIEEHHQFTPGELKESSEYIGIPFSHTEILEHAIPALLKIRDALGIDKGQSNRR